MHLFRHAVWQHLKTHSREQMQPMQLCICSGRHFEKTFENSLRRKIVQMQPMRLWICSARQWQKTLENSLLGTAYPTLFHPQWWEDTSLWQLWAKQEIWKSTSSFTLEKNLQLRKMLVLKCWILWPQYWRLSDLKWPPDKGRVEVLDGDLGVLVAQQDGLFCHQPAPSSKLIASHQFERPAPSCFIFTKGSSFPAPFFNFLILDWIGFTTDYGVPIHAKSGWYLWYITANFFRFSAIF